MKISDKVKAWHQWCKNMWFCFCCSHEEDEDEDGGGEGVELLPSIVENPMQERRRTSVFDKDSDDEDDSSNEEDSDSDLSEEDEDGKRRGEMMIDLESTPLKGGDENKEEEEDREEDDHQNLDESHLTKGQKMGRDGEDDDEEEEIKKGCFPCCKKDDEYIRLMSKKIKSNSVHGKSTSGLQLLGFDEMIS